MINEEDLKLYGGAVTDDTLNLIEDKQKEAEDIASGEAETDQNGQLEKEEDQEEPEAAKPENNPQQAVEEPEKTTTAGTAGKPEKPEGKKEATETESQDAAQETEAADDTTIEAVAQVDTPDPENEKFNAWTNAKGLMAYDGSYHNTEGYDLRFAYDHMTDKEREETDPEKLPIMFLEKDNDYSFAYLANTPGGDSVVEWYNSKENEGMRQGYSLQEVDGHYRLVKKLGGRAVMYAVYGQGDVANGKETMMTPAQYDGEYMRAYLDNPDNDNPVAFEIKEYLPGDEIDDDSTYTVTAYDEEGNVVPQSVNGKLVDTRVMTAEEFRNAQFEEGLEMEIFSQKQVMEPVNPGYAAAAVNGYGENEYTISTSENQLKRWEAKAKTDKWLNGDWELEYGDRKKGVSPLDRGDAQYQKAAAHAKKVQEAWERKREYLTKRTMDYTIRQITKQNKELGAELEKLDLLNQDISRIEVVGDQILVKLGEELVKFAFPSLARQILATKGSVSDAKSIALAGTIHQQKMNIMAAQKYLKEVETNVNAPSKYDESWANFFMGAGASAMKLDTWLMGYGEEFNTDALRPIMMKIQKVAGSVDEKTLASNDLFDLKDENGNNYFDDSERMLIRAFLLNQQTKSATNDFINQMFMNGYSGMESAAFTAEFIISSLVFKGAGAEGMTAKVASKMTNVLQRAAALVRSGAKAEASSLITKMFGSAATQSLARSLYKLAPGFSKMAAEEAYLAATTAIRTEIGMQYRMAKAENRIRTVKNDDGTARLLDSKELAKENMKSFVDSYIEYWSEGAFEYGTGKAISNLFGKVAKMAGAGIPITARDAFERIFMTSYMGQAARVSGLSGLLPEYNEEILGAGARAIVDFDKADENFNGVRDTVEEFKDMFTWDRFINTVASFGITMGAGAAINGARKGVSAIQFEKYQSKGIEELRKCGVDEETLQRYDKMIRGDAKIEDLMNTFAAMTSIARTKNPRMSDRALKNATLALMYRYRTLAIDAYEPYRTRQQIDAYHEEMKKDLGGEFVNEGGMVRVILSKDGKRRKFVYTAGKGNNLIILESGKKPVMMKKEMLDALVNDDSNEEYGSEGIISADQMMKEDLLRNETRADQRRMRKEREAQIASLRKGMAGMAGATIKIGPEGSKIEVNVDGEVPGGVRVTIGKEAKVITWEEYAAAVGTPIVVKTKQQIEAEEDERAAAEEELRVQDGMDAADRANEKASGADDEVDEDPIVVAPDPAGEATGDEEEMQEDLTEDETEDQEEDVADTIRYETKEERRARKEKAKAERAKRKAEAKAEERKALERKAQDAEIGTYYRKDDNGQVVLDAEGRPEIMWDQLWDESVSLYKKYQDLYNRDGGKASEAFIRMQYEKLKQSTRDALQKYSDRPSDKEAGEELSRLSKKQAEVSAVIDNIDDARLTQDAAVAVMELGSTGANVDFAIEYAKQRQAAAQKKVDEVKKSEPKYQEGMTLEEYKAVSQKYKAKLDKAQHEADVWNRVAEMADSAKDAKDYQEAVRAYAAQAKEEGFKPSPFKELSNEDYNEALVYQRAYNDTMTDRKKNFLQMAKDRAAFWKDRVGADVKVITDVAELSSPEERTAFRQLLSDFRKGKQDTKGWMSTSTGQVYVYAPFAKNLEDIDTTVMHEHVAHRGLRSLLGAQQFDQLTDQVWDGMSETLKDYFMKYVNPKGSMKENERQSYQRMAADEYMAHMSEQYTPEELQEMTLAENIRGFINNALRKLGWKKDVSAADLKWLLSRSYRNKDNAKGYDEYLKEKKESDKNSTRFSLTTLAQAAGLRFGKMNGATIFRDSNGKIVGQVTPEMIRTSMLGTMIHMSVKNGFIAPENEAKQCQFFADLFTMMQNIQDVDLVWAVSGALGFSPVKAEDLDENGMYVPKSADKQQKFAATTDNSDPQYATTVDFTTICLKTQAVIDVMSEVMKREHRGLTPEEIIDIVYKQTHLAGEPVPCPVCYVFSRWVGLGGLLGNMKKWQEQYEGWSLEDINGRIAELDAKLARSMGYASVEEAMAAKSKSGSEDDEVSESGSWYGSKDLQGIIKSLSDEDKDLRDMLDRLTNPLRGKIIRTGKDGKTKKSVGMDIDDYFELIDELVAELDKRSLIDSQKGSSLKLVAGTNLATKLQELRDKIGADLEMYNEYAWLKRVRTDAEYETKGKVPEEILLDINRGLDFATDYPVAWGYRTTRGPALGKAAAPYSPLKIGQVVTMVGSNNENARNDEKNPFQNPDATDKDRETMILKAIAKARVQNLRNGQRWQSTSDFRYEYVLDYIMGMLEMQAVGSKVQLYTKVPEAVPLLATFGAEVNCSLMARGDGFQDGKLVFSAITGMDDRDARMLRDLYDNVQPIIVGISPEHIRACMRTHWLTFIIPFHASGGTEDAYRSMMATVEERVENRTDFSAYQNDKVLSVEKITPQQRDARTVRTKILSGAFEKTAPTAQEIATMKRVPFLETMYERFYGMDLKGNPVAINKDCYHAFCSSGEADLKNMMVMPFEYWDYNAVYKEKYEEGDIPASVNGARFIQYCGFLGITPRFSGTSYNKDGVASYNEEMDFSNEEGYWKVLIDRRMYNADGTAHMQKPIDITNVKPVYFADKDGNMLPSQMSGKDAAKALYDARTVGQGIVNPSKLNKTERVKEIAQLCSDIIALKDKTRLSPVLYLKVRKLAEEYGMSAKGIEEEMSPEGLSQVDALSMYTPGDIRHALNVIAAQMRATSGARSDTNKWDEAAQAMSKSVLNAQAALARLEAKVTPLTQQLAAIESSLQDENMTVKEFNALQKSRESAKKKLNKELGKYEAQAAKTAKLEANLEDSFGVIAGSPFTIKDGKAVLKQDTMFRKDADESFEKSMASVNSEQKTVEGKYADAAELDDIRFRLSNNNRAIISKWIDKWAEASEGDVSKKEDILNYLDKLNDSTMQLAWARWFCTGAVQMGAEDMPKVRQAVKVAKIHKVDPLQYDSPMAIINQWPESVKEDPINPDEIVTLHKVKELPDGIVIYDVDDSEESRKNMREIINTHFGKDCSPWCLLQGDGNGKLTKYSADYWYNTYNAYTKQVAFKNGKLVAFSANSNEDRLWWDRQDRSHHGIPAIGKIKGDKLGRSATMEYSPEDGSLISVTDIVKGNKQDGKYMEWLSLDNDTPMLEETHSHGYLVGRRVVNYRNGQTRKEENYENGYLSGRAVEYFEDGQIKTDANYVDGRPDGSFTSYYENGQVYYTGTYKRGDKVGRWKTFYNNGQINKDEVYDKWWNPLESVEYYPDGSKMSESHSVSRPYGYGTVSEQHWDRQGRLVSSKRMTPSSSSYGYADLDIHEITEYEYNELGVTIKKVEAYQGQRGGDLYSALYFDAILQKQTFTDRGAYKNNDVVYDEWYDADGKRVAVTVQKLEKYNGDWVIDQLKYRYDENGNVTVKHYMMPRGLSFVKDEDLLVNETRDMLPGEKVPSVDELYNEYKDNEFNPKEEQKPKSSAPLKKKGKSIKDTVNDTLAAANLYMGEDMGGDVTIGGTVNGVEYPFIVFDDLTYEDFLENGYTEEELGRATPQQEEAYAKVQDDINYYQANGYWSDEADSEDGTMFRKALRQAHDSAATSINGNKLPAAFNKIGWQAGTLNLDLGGGKYDNATDFLATKGVLNMIFDPFNRDAEWNKRIVEAVKDGGVNTVTCNNVLNVIDNADSRANVILQAAKALRPDGTAYFYIYEGDKTGEGKDKGQGRWQNNMPTADYIPEIQKYFQDVTRKGQLIVAKTPVETDEQSVWSHDGKFDGTNETVFRKVDAKVSADVDAKKITVKEGGRTETYARNSKYGVGKDMMGKIYFHKNYADEILPEGMAAKADQIAQAEGIEYQCMTYDPKNPNLVRLDQAPDFDTAREPIPGMQMWVNTDTMQPESKPRMEKQIWHHKWMWVKDDYQGFDVQQSFDWSKQWLEKIAKPMARMNRWNEELEQAGLPVVGETMFRKESKEIKRAKTDLAKEILENGFNEVSLQHFNDLLERVKNGEVELSGRLPETCGAFIAGRDKLLAGQILLWRIAEAASRKAQRSGKTAAEIEKEVEARANSLIESWAKAKDIWIDVPAYQATHTLKAKGTASEVYESEDGRSVVKLATLKHKDKWSPDWDTVAIHNLIFPETAYSVMGYGRNEKGEFVSVLSQPAILIDRVATESETEVYMNKKGFEKHPNPKYFDVYKSKEFVVSDLKVTNVVITEGGKTIVIDADCSYNTPLVGGTYKQTPLDTEYFMEEIDGLGQTMFKKADFDADAALKEAYMDLSSQEETKYKNWAENSYNLFIEDFKVNSKRKDPLVHLGTLIKDAEVNARKSLKAGQRAKESWKRAFELTYYKAYERAANEMKAMYKEMGYEVGEDLGLKSGHITSNEVAELFNRLNKNEYNKKLFDRVRAVCDALGVEYRIKTIDSEGTAQGGFVLYDVDTMNCAYFTNARKSETILHEMIHGVTSYAMGAIKNRNKSRLYAHMYDQLTPEQIRAASQIMELWGKICSDPEFSGTYGRTNSYEMIAEISNPEFREKLEKKGLWKAVKDAIREFFERFWDLFTSSEKENRIQTNALKEAEEALDYLLENYNRTAFQTEHRAASTLSKYNQGVVRDTMFRSVEITPEVRDEMETIKATAFVNGTYMKGTDGKTDSKLNEEQWALVRTKAFKDWFGDWEKSARIKKLLHSKTAVITGTEIAVGKDYKETRKNALEYGKTLRGEYTNRDTGNKFILYSGKNGGVKEILEHDYKDTPHLLSIAAIPQIAENSIYIDSRENEDTTKHPDIVRYDYYVCGLKIGNEDYTAKAAIAVAKNGQKYYDHKLTAIEKGKLIDELARKNLSQSGLSSVEDRGETNASYPAVNGEDITSSPISVVKDIRLLSLLQDNSSKVIDAETGEPMVVYHGSEWEPLKEEEGNAVFNIAFKRWSSYGGGIYVSPNKNIANSNGKVVGEYFANVRNPIVVGENDKDVFNEITGLKKPRTREVMDELVKLGYDGISDINHPVYPLVSLFSPNQIKSATDNNGEFNPTDPDIRFRKVTTKQDAEYMDAVKAGDMDKARQMVDAAAESSMPRSQVRDENGKLLHVYHGTRAEEKFWVFDTYGLVTGDNSNVGAHFGPRETADEFSKENQYDTYLNLEKLYEAPFDFFADNFNNAYLEILIDLRDQCEKAEAKDIFNRIYDIYPDLYNYDLEEIKTSLSEEFDGDEGLEEMEEVDGRFGRFRRPKYFSEHRSAMVDIMREMMEAEGFDGIVYNNWYEGEFENRCYVALYPSQIKSADPVTYDNDGNVIPLSERFNESNPDIRFRFVGQNAARNLEFYGDNTLSESLENAKRMKANGKDARAIKLATGWELGADKKWRYEQVDFLLRDENSATFMPRETKRLEDIINPDDNIVKEYPGIKRTKVQVKSLSDNKYGYYDHSTNTIVINTKYTDQVEMGSQLNELTYLTLLHEVQHAIQLQEDFAYGTNPMAPDISAEDKQAIKDLRRENESMNKVIGNYADVISSLQQNFNSLQEKVNGIFAGPMEVLPEENPEYNSAVKQMADISNEAKNLRDKQRELLDRISSNVSKISDIEKAAGLIGFDNYEAYAGEVEARNVSSRAFMSEEERRISLASDTETRNNGKPISRDEQIVKLASEIVSRISISDSMMNMFQEAPSELKDKFIEESARAGYNFTDGVSKVLADMVEYGGMDEDTLENLQAFMSDAYGFDMDKSQAMWAAWKYAHRNDSGLLAEARKVVVGTALGHNPYQEEVIADAAGETMFRRTQSAYFDSALNMYTSDMGFWFAVNETWKDQYESVNLLAKAIAETSLYKGIQDDEDVEAAFNQLSSKIKDDKDNYVKNYLEPMWDVIKALTAREETMEEIQEYVLAKSGLERNVVFAQRDARNAYKQYLNEKLEELARYNKMSASEKAAADAALASKIRSAERKVNDRLMALNMVLAQPGHTLDQCNEAVAKLNEAEAERDALLVVQMRDENALRNEYAAHEADIMNGTDLKFLENRKRDYSGLIALFDEKPDVKRMRGESPAKFRERVKAMTTNRANNDLETAERLAESRCYFFERHSVIGSDKELKELGRKAGKGVRYANYAVGTNLAEELWKRIKAANDATLRHQLETGMINQESYDHLSNMMKYYVPLRGFDGVTADDAYSYSHGMPVTSMPIKEAKGRKSRAADPFANIAVVAESGITVGDRNMAKMALYKLISRRGENDAAMLAESWFEDTGKKDSRGREIYRKVYPDIKADATPEDVRQAWDDLDYDMGQRKAAGEKVKKGKSSLDLSNEVVFTSSSQSPEHAIKLMVDGYEETIILTGNPRAAQAVEGKLNIDASENPLYKVPAFLTRLRAGLSTSWNPEFVMTNALRDAQTAMATAFVEGGVKGAAEYAATVAKIVHANRMFRLMSSYDESEKKRGARKTMPAIDANNPKLTQYFKEFMENGATTGFSFMQGMDEYEDKLRKYALPNAYDKIAAAFEKAGEGFQFMNEGVENLWRFAAYVQARENGEGVRSSAGKAKEITVNFNRKGSGMVWTPSQMKSLNLSDNKAVRAFQEAAIMALTAPAPLLRPTVMFVNATVQGLVKTINLYKTNAFRALAATAVGPLLLGVVVALLNAGPGDDPEEENTYLKLTPYERRQNICVSTGNGKYIKIPLPQEYRMWYALGEMMISDVKYKNDPSESIPKEMWDQLWELTPWNLTEGADILRNTGFGPLYDIAVNENFMGQEVYHENKYATDSERENDPNWKKATNMTKPWVVKVCKWLSDVTGGDELGFTGGAIDWNPGIVQHLVEGYGGGALTTVSKFEDLFQMLTGNMDFTFKRTPFLGRIMTDVDEKNSSTYANNLYDWFMKDFELLYNVSEGKGGYLDLGKSVPKKFARNKNMSVLNDAINQGLITFTDKGKPNDEGLEALLEVRKDIKAEMKKPGEFKLPGETDKEFKKRMEVQLKENSQAIGEYKWKMARKLNELYKKY